MTQPDPARSASRCMRLGRLDGLYALLCLLSLLPPLLFRYPQSVDYLNHLMRVHVLTAPAGSLARSYFQPDWRPLANLGLDLLSWPIAMLASPEIALKLVWLLCMTGFASGAWYLHRAVYEKTQPAFLLVALFLFNLPLTMGFLNFSLGVAGMLFGFGLWLRCEGRMTAGRLLAFNLLALATMICHIAAAGALGLTILLYELLAPRGTLWKRGVRISAGFLLPALWFLLVAISHPIISKTGRPDSIQFVLGLKPLLFLTPVFTGYPLPNVMDLAFVWIIALALMWRRRKARRPLGVILLWWLLVILLPSNIGDAGFIDTRLALFPCVLTFCLLSGPAAEAPETAPRERLLLAGLACVLVPASLLVMLPSWRSFNADVASFQAIEDTIPLHAKILVAKAPRALMAHCAHHSFAPFGNSMTTLAVADRGAFVDVFFADPNLQPVAPKPVVRDLYKPNAPPFAFEDLMARDSAAPGAAPIRPLEAQYAAYFPDDWARDYDILAMEHPRCAPPPWTPANLSLIARSRSYFLYAIRHPVPRNGG